MKITDEAVEAAARVLVPVWFGGFEDQSEEGFPGTPNRRAIDTARAALEAAFPHLSQGAGEREGEPPTDAEAKARLAEIVAKNPEDFYPGTNPLGDTSAALPHMGGVSGLTVSTAIEDALRELDNVTANSGEDANRLGCAENLLRQALDALSDYEALRAENERLREFERQHDYCCCGSRMEDHDIGSGHSPVSMYNYSYQQATERAEDAEARIAELVKALEESRRVLAKLLSAGHNSPSATPEEIDAAFWSVDAALGGRSNE